jgi:hypothetical protein
MPDAEMIRHYGDIRIAFNVDTLNQDRAIRNIIFARHPALYFKHGKSR